MITHFPRNPVSSLYLSECKLGLGREKTFSRKMSEALLAYRLERALSKKDILTIYLNEIYLGEGAYGVEAAALTYFGKRAADLNLAEMALLAGLTQSPGNYSPLRGAGGLSGYWLRIR